MNIFKQSKYMCWHEYTNKIAQIEYWLFIDNIARESLKNIQQEVK